MDDREAREDPALFPGVLLAVNCYTEGRPVSLYPSLRKNCQLTVGGEENALFFRGYLMLSSPNHKL